jgi:hypothetical protein
MKLDVFKDVAKVYVQVAGKTRLQKNKESSGQTK